MDGNKRNAWAAMRTFLIINGAELKFGDLEAIRFDEQVAASIFDFEDVSAWISGRLDMLQSFFTKRS